jgi:hypothetical protein
VSALLEEHRDPALANHHVGLGGRAAIAEPHAGQDRSLVVAKADRLIEDQRVECGTRVRWGSLGREGLAVDLLERPGVEHPHLGQVSRGGKRWRNGATCPGVHPPASSARNNIVIPTTMAKSLVAT